MMLMRCYTLRRVLHSLFLLALVVVYGCVSGTISSVAAAVVSEGFSVPEKQKVFDNSIFAYIEKLQLEHWNKNIKKSNNNDDDDDKNGKTFGRLLDAGTGIHSLRWISTLAPSFTKDDDNEGNDRDGTQRQRRRRQQRHPSNKKTHPGGGITEFIAITSSSSMQQRVQKEMDELELNDIGLVHNGNWFPNKNDNDNDDLSVMVTARHNKIVKDDDDDNDYDNDDNDDTPPLLLFDTIIVDYLIGAMDAFSPYQQDVTIEKLARLLKPGTGRLYIDGMSPIPDSVSNPDDNLFCQITKLRDACIHLVDKVGSVQRPYREFPLAWMERQITNGKSASKLLELVPGTTKKFPITYTHSSIVRQLDTARSKLKFIMNNTTRAALTLQLEDLEQKAKVACQQKNGGRLNVGSYNYVVVAQRRKEEETRNEQEQETTTHTTSSSTSNTTSTSTKTDTSTSTKTSFLSSYYDSWKEKSDELYATMEDQDLLVPLLVVVFLIVMVTVLLLSIVTVLISVVVMMMMMLVMVTGKTSTAVVSVAAAAAAVVV
mmetsp:Transcript_26569/g.30193  ORF Transcript_26569/g.30193 Transcript_26569/m.30193 type:complete len:542 (+) Transcript_26569:56-1681(+)